MSNFNIAVAPCNLLMPPSGSSIISVSNPELTIPPPPAGGSSTFALTFDSEISSPTVSNPPTGATWSSPSLTLSSSFQGGTITIQWAGGNSTTFSIVVSSAPASSATTNLTVNADGSFFVTSMGSGVTLTDGVTSLVTSIPSGGQVQVIDPVFFVTNTSNSFSLAGASSVTLGTITAGSGLSVSPPGSTTVTVSNWSALDNSEVTVDFTLNGASSSLIFIVVQSVRTASTGGTTNLTVNNAGLLVVTALSPDAYLTGIDLEYQTTTAGSYGFGFDSAGTPFDGGNNFTITSGQNNDIFGSLTQSSSSDSFTDTNTAGVDNSSGTFTIATNEGVLDPTILNNPDT